MATLAAPLAEELAETAHRSDDPSVCMEDREYDKLAFELWHLGSYLELIEVEEWEDRPDSVASRASCL